MTAALKLSWHERVSLSAGQGEAIVTGPGARLSLRPVAPEILDALQRLAPPGEVEDTLAETILAAGDVQSLARWYFHVDQFHRRGLLCRTLQSEDGPLATLVPVCHAIPSDAAAGPIAAPGPRVPPGRRLDAVREAPALCYTWSRFAYLRREGSAMVAESPLSRSRLILHDPRALSVIGAMSSGARLEEICEAVPTLATGSIAGLVRLFDEASLIDVTNIHPLAANAVDDKPDEHFESWEFHDLLFHARSRRGRSDAQFGATYRLAHRPPPPALKSIASGRWHDLYRPDLKQLERDDPPFAQVQNQRRSLRQYGAEPLSAQQLAEFLYRVGRVTGGWTADIPGAQPAAAMDFAGRPFPSGGALYELEMYPVIRGCRDLPAGMYAYEPATHRLRQVSGCTADVDSLLDEAAASAGVDPQSIQVLIVLASRFARIAWKYESIAYALTLKHVGVVYQTMYLAATAMGLAPCAVGCGDSDLFARAAGTEYHVESSVGEFLLGSRE